MARGPGLLTIGALGLGAFWAAQRGYLGEGARKWAASLGVSLPAGDQGTDKPADPAQPPPPTPAPPQPEWRNWGPVNLRREGGVVVAYRTADYKGPQVSLTVECAAVQVIGGRDGPQREEWTNRWQTTVGPADTWRPVVLSARVPLNVSPGTPYRVWLAVKYAGGTTIKFDRYGQDLWLPNLPW